ncbi:MAG: hypothetical protein EAZ90_01055 [Oscillatoriales cyanobacterium]|nr:MAG: hypothetical protein EAZ94_30175 [Oscillatoriales cyanobacterium]TAE30338.1 MAG: hypothetical protein EAZ93_00920 [Oscillatoriales cyanobacterium]TAE45847.1 MAG: hypothetical protein EAZ90_01055 [Oscillatoriales cyanobacterium]TAE69789.1 MAG: hypothetical protein EAZ86_09315 [Oscillatoriales cyanobacterium]TAF89013.1 MAG: hypothetical protein EAZ49_14770 [Oscillatoriales cyanobacterium]
MVEFNVFLISGWVGAGFYNCRWVSYNSVNPPLQDGDKIFFIVFYAQIRRGGFATEFVTHKLSQKPAPTQPITPKNLPATWLNSMYS